jgi:hypothetical protein
VMGDKAEKIALANVEHYKKIYKKRAHDIA